MFFDPRSAGNTLTSSQEATARDWVRRHRERDDDDDDDDAAAKAAEAGKALPMRKVEEKRGSARPGDRDASSGRGGSKSPERDRGGVKPPLEKRASQSPKAERRTTGPSRSPAGAKRSSAAAPSVEEKDRLELERLGWFVGIAKDSGKKYYYTRDKEVQWNHPITGEMA